ncbi:phosphate ABC transporter ATP-binding protein, PhoT family (TC 3.A.1.7.1) [Halogeometricum rufum]|uniref:Phosphate ABC transporter ATP-binding protein, PhoT family (TC 3.A.1.7.1) n=1 Tax=Halogeometricum rufum TaxID=553469 RepID=A0A1I6IPR9_9EURY|nr:ATP-binding cassette domain-containing protein [Halogeometricum rufum]SFR68718.1 phosphate ABC transporter ATP-binding protein, PhoT family (TC 3.A.1.7.1) [Halogeometricum rufum]
MKHDTHASESEDAPLLETERLTRLVDGTAVVDTVSVTVSRGEVLAVVGPSGAGKSSFLRLLNRLDEPSSGSVYVEGVDYRELSPRTLRQRIGLVPQQPSLVPGTVWENVVRGPTLRDEPVPEERTRELLERLDIADYEAKDVGDLSGGEAQRVALTRTLVNDPDAFLLDEPTSNLDAGTEAYVEALIREVVADFGIACVIVTHDPDQARRLADRVLSLEDGAVSDLGPAREVLSP